jgi:hypothetical protein
MCASKMGTMGRSMVKTQGKKHQDALNQSFNINYVCAETVALFSVALGETACLPSLDV